jgi:hypothetical protein
MRAVHGCVLRSRFSRGLSISLFAALTATFAIPGAAWADTVVTLNTDFVEQLKNRPTIDVAFVVDKAHAHPNPPEKDGDMHVAGRAEQIGLPTVAEIENANEAQSAMSAVHAAEGTGRSLAITGVWRIWPEHGGDNEQVQFAPVPRIETTNPPHVFEIHPVTRIGSLDLLAELHPIGGFQAKDAEEAFRAYERTRAHIKPSPDGKTVTISMEMAGFNYVDFIMQLTKREFSVEDGEFVFGKILDRDGDLLVHNRRIVFVKGSHPDEKQRAMQIGDCIHLIGIPRLDLALVSWRVQHAADRPEVLTWNMPYEIVAVGAYDDDTREVCHE